MDPLSISSGIAGLVALADLVFRAATRYVKSAKKAPTEAIKLLEEVKGFSVLLHDLSLVAYGLETDPFPENTMEPAHEFQAYHLYGCRRVLEDLQSRLDCSTQPLVSDSTLKKLGARLKWPMTTQETTEMLQTIQRHKQTINIALSVDTLQKLRESLSKQQETNSRINQLQEAAAKIIDIETRIFIGQEREKVLDFFLKTNPRDEYRKNKELRHYMTGLWLTEGAQFKQWCNVKGSKLWLSGIPGAGKSVLAGAMVDECLKISTVIPETATAYFFCTYRDNNTHEPENIMSSIVAQLARQNEAAFSIAQKYYQELTKDDHLAGTPSINKLRTAIRDICGVFEKVLIIVDGLDECGSHVERTTRMLASLWNDKSAKTMCLALLSRDEIIIRQHLQGAFDYIEIEAHTGDIQQYVATELEERIGLGKLRVRNMSLKDEILEALVTGAKGMSVHPHKQFSINELRDSSGSGGSLVSWITSAGC